MKRILLFSVLMSATAAVAQPAGVLSLRWAGDYSTDTYTYGAGECGDTITLTWNNLSLYNFQQLQCPSNGAKMWATTASSCGTEPAAGDLSLGTLSAIQLSTTRTGPVSVRIADLPGHTAIQADGGVGGCPLPMPSTLSHQICISYHSNVFSGVSCSASQVSGSGTKFVYDTLPPSAPNIVQAVAQDGAASVEFTVDSDTEEVLIEVKGPTDPDFTETGTAVVANTNTVRAEGLTNDVRYEIRLRARDGAGNVSDPSGSEFVTPILTYGLLGYYGSEGNSLEGGCSSAGGLLPMLFVAWALRSRFRRNKGSSSR